MFVALKALNMINLKLPCMLSEVTLLMMKGVINLDRT